MAFKEIKKGHEARLAIKAGIDKACDAVMPTLGPIGMTALIEFPGLDPIECDDGVTILKNLEFKDHYENLGVQKLRKAAIRTSTEVGDGTATTTALTKALVEAAFKEIANDSSKIRETRERLGEGLKDIIRQLSKIKRDVAEDDIERIANISSLDSEVSKIISEIIKEIGPDGIIEVQKGSQFGYTKEVVKGARFDKGLISQYFINDQEKEQCVLDNPYIALIDRKVSLGAQIKGIMDAIKDHKSILFIADDIDGIALASLIQASKTVTFVNAQGQQTTGLYDVACVRNPYTATPSRDFLKDMAALTGATIISEEAGIKLSEAGIQFLGRAEKVIVTKETTTIIGCKDGEALQTRILSIEKDIEATTSEFSKSMFKERLSRLKGGVGVIRVGAYTDTDFNAKKYKFDNAIASVQAAMKEGILPGGGSALAKIEARDPIFKDVLTAPLRQMAENAGIKDPKRVVKMVRFFEDNIGMDFVNKGYCNMFDAGIIDPFKVTRLALESAVAIATSVIGYETVITLTDETKDK